MGANLIATQLEPAVHVNKKKDNASRAVAVERRSAAAGAKSEAAHPQRFPKSARLLKHSAFDRVYRQGRRHFSPNLTVFYLRAAAGQEETGVRVGFTVGRALGGAVERNRIKRRLREAVRLSLAGFETSAFSAQADVVIAPKKAVLDLDFPALRREVEDGLRAVSEDRGAKRAARR